MPCRSRRIVVTHLASRSSSASAGSARCIASRFRRRSCGAARSAPDAAEVDDRHRTADARQRLPERARALAEGNEMLAAMVTSMLRRQAALRSELARLENRLRRIAGSDRVVWLMMTVPGVGAVVALLGKAGIDDPARFRSSKNVGPHFGLTPRPGAADRACLRTSESACCAPADRRPIHRRPRVVQ